MTLKYSENH